MVLTTSVARLIITAGVGLANIIYHRTSSRANVTKKGRSIKCLIFQQSSDTQNALLLIDAYNIVKWGMVMQMY